MAGLPCIKIFLHRTRIGMYETLFELGVTFPVWIKDKKLKRCAKNWIFHQNIILICSFSQSVYGYPTTRCKK
jgi:hypothetical protein